MILDLCWESAFVAVTRRNNTNHDSNCRWLVSFITSKIPKCAGVDLRMPMANTDTISMFNKHCVWFIARCISSHARCGCLHFNTNFKADRRRVESFSQAAESMFGKKNPESNMDVTM